MQTYTRIDDAGPDVLSHIKYELINEQKSEKFASFVAYYRMGPGHKSDVHVCLGVHYQTPYPLQSAPILLCVP